MRGAGRSTVESVHRDTQSSKIKSQIPFAITVYLATHKPLRELLTKHILRHVARAHCPSEFNIEPSRSTQHVQLFALYFSPYAATHQNASPRSSPPAPAHPLRAPYPLNPHMHRRAPNTLIMPIAHTQPGLSLRRPQATDTR